MFFYRNGQLVNRHDITAVSSPLGLREKFSTCIHEQKKKKRTKHKKYERFDSILLPLPLYEGEIKNRLRETNKQFKQLMKEKNIPTSYLEEIGRKVLKKEYLSAFPSVRYIVHEQEKGVEIIKGFIT